MITAVFALLSTRWVWYALGSLAAAAALWFGVINPYNNYVSAKAVTAALEEERAFTVPKIANLEGTVNELDATIAKIHAESDAEKARQVAAVDLKTKELKNALTQNKTLKADLAKLRGISIELDSVLNTISAINNSASGASASSRLKQLSAAHQQCERALRESDSDLAETLGRLDEALAVVRALKN
jgi:predicted  nucleic acid-binding Zn-ribbon protein